MPVLGYRTDTLPLFYAAAGGPPVSARVESAERGRRIARAHWELGAPALPLDAPPEPSPRRRRAADRGSARRRPRSGVHGHAVTPFVLAHLHRESGGRTLRANQRPHRRQRALAGEIAVA